MKIAIDDQCVNIFKDLKFRKIEAGYLVYKIQKEVVKLDKAGPKEHTWHDFLAQLPLKEYRFVVYDLKFTNKDNMHVSKVFFLNWNPQGTPIKHRMLYATAKQNFKAALDLNTKQITLNSVEDLTEEGLIKQFDK